MWTSSDSEGSSSCICNFVFPEKYDNEGYALTTKVLFVFGFDFLVAKILSSDLPRWKYEEISFADSPNGVASQFCEGGALG